MAFITNALKWIFLMIDGLIIDINGYLFQIFFGLTNVRFENTYLFDTLANRLYVLIGIFMVFRVTFSLIQMLANPDMISDKEKGFGKLTTRIVISLTLLVATPFIFEKAMDIQDAIIKENIISEVLLGVNLDNTNIKAQGNSLAITVFKGFVSPNEKAENDDNFKLCNGIKDEETNTYSGGSISKSTLSGIKYANNKKINCFTETDSNGETYYTYLFGASTIGGLMLAWLVVGFCIDIATRLVKLGFYQIIAPIPIISYINGDKNGPFNTWVKKCVSSYVSIFIKLLVIYFVIYMCSIITNSGIDLNTAFSGASFGVKQLAFVAIILGLLVFAKSAPKLIKDMFGIKGDDDEGGFTKQLAKAALLGGAGMMAAGASNAAFGLNNAIGEWKKGNVGKGFLKLGKGALSTVGGMGAGLRNGAINGYANKGANPFSGLGKSVLQSNQARYNRSKMWAATEGEGNLFQRAAKYYGGTAFDMALGRTGIDTTVGNREKTLKNKLAGIQSARSANSQARYAMINNGRITESESSALNRFTYDAFKDSWYETIIHDDGKVDIIDHGKKEISDIATIAHVTGADAEEYLRYVKDDGGFNRAEVELNKQLGVVTQVKEKREGKLDR